VIWLGVIGSESLHLTRGNRPRHGRFDLNLLVAASGKDDEGECN
jgi:hypothetical protein